MRSRNARVMPEAFDGVEFGRIRRQVVSLPPRAIVLEPSFNVAVMVIRGVVLNEEDAAGIIMTSEAFKKIQIGLGVENGSPMVEEAGGINVQSAENLDAVSLAGDGNERLVAAPGPSGVKRGILPEACLVLENQRRLSGTGFFFSLGYVCRCQRSCFSGSARARSRLGRWTEKPKPWSSLRTCPG